MQRPEQHTTGCRRDRSQRRIGLSELTESLNASREDEFGDCQCWMERDAKALLHRWHSIEMETWANTENGSVEFSQDPLEPSTFEKSPELQRAIDILIALFPCDPVSDYPGSFSKHPPQLSMMGCDSCHSEIVHRALFWICDTCTRASPSPQSDRRAKERYQINEQASASMPFHLCCRCYNRGEEHHEHQFKEAICAFGVPNGVDETQSEQAGRLRSLCVHEEKWRALLQRADSAMELNAVMSVGAFLMACNSRGEGSITFNKSNGDTKESGEGHSDEKPPAEDHDDRESAGHSATEDWPFKPNAEEFYPLEGHQNLARSRPLSPTLEDERPQSQGDNESYSITLYDDPIGVKVHQYLQIVDISGHRHAEAIQKYSELCELQIGHPIFNALVKWSVSCLLLADREFSERTKQPSLKAVLTPIQWSTFCLLKEWWLGEIQDERLVHRQISEWLLLCVATSEMHLFVKRRQNFNRYSKDYHGTLKTLFEAEFTINSSGTPLVPILHLKNKRTRASIEACVQRFGFMARHPTLSPAWFMFKTGKPVNESVTTACQHWKMKFALECTDVLGALWRFTGPTSGKAENVLIQLIRLVTEGPMELFIADILSAQQIMGTKRLTANLATLPWLSNEGMYDEYPRYLWDVRAKKTVQVASMTDRPRYIAVSHTWGRWRNKAKSSLQVEGVPWLLPQNDLWQVSEIPTEMQKVPGDFSFVWFDLLCIPQGQDLSDELVNIKRQEIAKQAAIFANAERTAAWFGDTEDLGLEYLALFMSHSVGKFASEYRAENRQITEMVPQLLDLPGLLKKRQDDPESRDKYHTSIWYRDEELPDPLQHFHPWFTSLWTLQEASMRPDMWLCRRDWQPLRPFPFNPNARFCSHHNISLDGLIALFNDDTAIGQFQTEAFKMGTIDSAEDPSAFFDRFQDGLMSDMWAPEALNPALEHPERALLSGDAPNRYTKTMQHVHNANALLKCVRLDYLLQTSPIEVLTLADLRYCQGRRAEAIMSVVGAVEWFETAKPDDMLVLDRYPIAFLEEVRRKVGHHRFFNAPILAPTSVALVETYARTGSIPSPVGSLLSFGTKSTDNTLCTMKRFETPRLDIFQQSCLSRWEMKLDGSVRLPRAAIFQSTKDPKHICDCLEIDVREVRACKCSACAHGGAGVADAETPSVVSTRNTVHPKDWADAHDCPCYLICLDFSMEIYDNKRDCDNLGVGFFSNGIVLQEVDPGVFVKTGTYFASGQHREHLFPRSTAVEWIVL
ncbi:MAG: hypothetical protein M1831_002987 [Alyxoria varia]|nr:MAG: hypothetical protein M1831_002987 [Alyxoria varia]